jgi:hypothetical protein
MRIEKVAFINWGLIVGVIDSHTWVIADESSLYYDEDDNQCVNEAEPHCVVEVDSDQHEPEYVSVEDETALAQFLDRPIVQIQGDELDIAIDVRTMKKLQYDADEFNQFCESL